jgi:hypothetical protein
MLDMVINWWAVLVAAVVGYLIGAVWYAPAVLGNRWMTALGKSRDQLGSPALPMTVQFIVTVVIAVILAAVIARFGAWNAVDGARVGFIVAVGLIGASMLTDWLFSGWSMKLFWIQCGYKVVFITVMGAILGAWH